MSAAAPDGPGGGGAYAPAGADGSFVRDEESGAADGSAAQDGGQAEPEEVEAAGVGRESVAGGDEAQVEEAADAKGGETAALLPSGADSSAVQDAQPKDELDIEQPAKQKKIKGRAGQAEHGAGAEPDDAHAPTSPAADALLGGDLLAFASSFA